MAKQYTAGYRRKGDDLYYLNKDGERTKRGEIKYRSMPAKIRINAFLAKKKKQSIFADVKGVQYHFKKTGDFGPIVNYQQKLIKEWLTGDLDAAQHLLYSIAKCAESVQTKIHINCGYRTREEQNRLYQLFLAGKGAPANPPGTSKHETKQAADAQTKSGTSFWNIEGIDVEAKKQRLFQPYPHEAWHVEKRKK